MSYTAPVPDMIFTMEHIADWRAGLGTVAAELGGAEVETILDQAGRFASEVIAPLNRPSDISPSVWVDGEVRTPAGWREAFAAWRNGGWNGVSLPAAYGGMGLPVILGTATMEMLTSACLSLSMLPVLVHGAVEALEAHADDALKQLYLPRLVSGEWAATMDLTEPQAGSDLGALRTRAEPAGDGTYRLFGQKIFISYGEHDLTDNIVHLVLARLPDAPPGTRGISLFLVPKFVPAADGSLGRRNDLRCTGLEHKLGIKASPTCTMVYGDEGGATGWLIGEPHKGLACMFTMMNRARLATGLQGVAIAERACQQALAYARERRQGRREGSAGAVPIVEHPDVLRNLMTMRALTDAARAIAYLAAAEIDRGRLAEDPARRSAAGRRADLLTPVVKAFSTDVGVEVASHGIQVHGGMGFIEETGAAQLQRDIRIAPIYEGTNGIQAIDLVTRKLPRDGGATVRALIAEAQSVADSLGAARDQRLGAMAERLNAALAAWSRATDWLLQAETEEALAVATPYLRLFALACGAGLLAKGALAALRLERDGNRDPAHERRIVTARFFAESLATAAGGLADTVSGSAAGIAAARAILADP